jgi:hypothetical protein
MQIKEEAEIRPVFWQDGAVVMIDQKALPLEERYVTCAGYREVIAAIKDLTVRGAPAIGVAAAMGITLASSPFPTLLPPDAFQQGEGAEGGMGRPEATPRWYIKRMQHRWLLRKYYENAQSYCSHKLIYRPLTCQANSLIRFPYIRRSSL